MTLVEFNEMAEKFIDSFGHSPPSEYYCTPAERAEHVMDDLRGHLFADELDRAERHKKFLELKAEFEPDDNGLY